MPDAAPSREIDYRPLTEPVDPRLAREHDRQLACEFGLGRPMPGLNIGCLVLMILTCGLLFGAAFGVGTLANPSVWGGRLSAG
ncbi:hypothetical protein [Psychromicrobium xiongbiense]|uniref:hypothetical protein n=1 Tax=Psychromicrobium xiongbiense TaxID=3051184 RepID=UPI00255304E8|nr:hypothetical protein [Psychromicrobium sp. YIM S02556]